MQDDEMMMDDMDTEEEEMDPVTGLPKEKHPDDMDDEEDDEEIM